MNEQMARTIADQFMCAAEIYASKARTEEERASWSVWWFRVPEANQLFGLAVEEVVKSNPKQLSVEDTRRALTYQYGSGPSLNTLALAPERTDKDQLREALTKQILQLANMRRSQKLEFIVENVVLKNPAPAFLGVELIPIPDEHMQKLHNDDLVPRILSTALAYARVEAFGDSTMAFNRALETVQRYLNLLRGCGVQLLLGQRLLPLRVVRAEPSDERVAYRDRPGAGAWTLRTFDIVRGVRVYEDLLSSFNQERINTLVSATTGTTTALLDAVTSSLETLGEATKRHSNATRILLISSALEMLVGYGATDTINFRGQTASIAERATFLIGEASVEGRTKMDRRIGRLYGKGSAVRHGSRPDISDDDVGELADLTHKVAMALIDRSKEWREPRDIDDWVKNMRYG